MRHSRTLISRILQIGIAPDAPPELAQFAMLTNGVTLFIQIACVISTVLCSALGSYPLAAIAAVTLVLTGAGFVFNTLGQHAFAGAWLIGVVDVCILGSAYVGGAYQVDTTAYFICGLPFLFFGLNDRRALGATLALTAATSAALLVPGIMPGPLFELDAGTREAVHVMVSTLTWLSLLLLLGYFARTRMSSAAKLRNALARAEVASAAKSAFLANTTHELRTPLGAILGYADLLLTPAQSPDERANFIRTIRRNGRHLLEIVDQVLDHAKIEAGQFEVAYEPCSPERVIADVEALMQVRAAAKNVDLSVEYETRIPELIETDELRVRQILVNLIGNAIKFTEEGQVVLRVSLASDEDEALLRFAVEDSGPGIEPNRLHEMFEPFTQADMSTQRIYGGTGLGLSISKQLAELIGGHLEAESMPGRGSTFTLVLPLGPENRLGELVDARVTMEPTKIRARTQSGMHGIRVLVAEDGPDNQRLFQLYLERAGAEAVVAMNGAKAIEAYERSLADDDPYSVILMDMQMPEMDGYEATRRLRAMGCELPIFALTAHAMVGAREECMRAGCDHYFVKPVEFDVLFSAVLNTLDERAARAHRSRAGLARPRTPLPLPAGVDDERLVPDGSVSEHGVIKGAGPKESAEDANAAFAAELAAMTRDFVQRLPEQVAEIAAAHAAGDTEQVRFLAHRLKGTAGVYGLDRVSELAAEIESQADDDGVARPLKEMTEIAVPASLG